MYFRDCSIIEHNQHVVPIISSCHDLDQRAREQVSISQLRLEFLLEKTALPFIRETAPTLRPLFGCVCGLSPRRFQSRPDSCPGSVVMRQTVTLIAVLFATAFVFSCTSSFGAATV
jgi:hypothetical protein